MTNVFDNPIVLTDAQVKALNPENLKAIASRADDGSWVATAFIETDESIVVCAISYGKNPKKVIKQALQKALGLFE